MDITQKVADRYARAASTGEQMCCPTSYDFIDLKSFIPEEVLKVSYGCGTPAGLKTVALGETVLDIGSGGGIDCFEAARRVGPSGHVIGIDITDTMLAIARKHAPGVANKLGYPVSNVEFRKGTADMLPVHKDTIDLIISNCVINLTPDKQKVFREMYRVTKPGGRFTLSDIVADQSVPQYLVHDTEKWGDCLSGALTLRNYIAGLLEAGFLGIHLLKSSPWQVIDGIHFFSVTLTGYKLLANATQSTIRYATLRGPFSRVVDELGTTYLQGLPQLLTINAARLLSQAPLAAHFILSADPQSFDQTHDQWITVYPPDTPCLWQGHFAMLAGPFVEAADDHHVYRRGEAIEISSRTLTVLETESYGSHFAIINRSDQRVREEPGSVTLPEESCCE